MNFTVVASILKVSNINLYLYGMVLSVLLQVDTLDEYMAKVLKKTITVTLYHPCHSQPLVGHRVQLSK